MVDTATILSVCSGAGGLDAGVACALETIGIAPVTLAYVEREASAAACLLGGMEAKAIHSAPVWCGDVADLDASPFRGVDLVIGGYPCTPFSTAGRCLGVRDPRHVWPSIRRVVAETMPGVCFFENVPGHVRLGFGQVERDLRELGYRVTAGLFSSQECGAPHRRTRLFILAYTDRQPRTIPTGQTRPGETTPDVARSSPAVADADDVRSGPRGASGQAHGERGRRLADIGDDVDKPHRTRRKGRRPTQPAGDTGAFGSGGVVGVTGLHDGRTVQDAEQTGATPESGCVELPRYPPNRIDFRSWAVVASVDPSVMPSIESRVRGMATGLVPWAERLRIVGNGCDPLAAALAFVSLASHIER